MSVWLTFSVVFLGRVVLVFFLVEQVFFLSAVFGCEFPELLPILEKL